MSEQRPKPRPLSALVARLTLIYSLASLIGCVTERQVIVVTGAGGAVESEPCGGGRCDGVGNINGELDWLEPSELEEAVLLAASRASGMIQTDRAGGTSRCSATLISEELLLTNHHCVPDEAAAKESLFYPETEREASSYQRLTRRFRCPELIATSCAHDVSILRCQKNSALNALPGDYYGYASLSLEGAYPGEALNLIHTNCDYRQRSGDSSCTPYKLISPGEVTSYGPRCIRFDGEQGCENCRSEAKHATHNADSLGGSSGGGIFSALTHKMIGVNWGGVAAEDQSDAPNYLTTLRDLVESEPEFAELLLPLVEGRGGEIGGAPSAPVAEPHCARLAGYLEGEAFDKALSVTLCTERSAPALSFGLCLEANGERLREGEPCQKSVMIDAALSPSQRSPLVICHPDISEPLRGRCELFDDRALGFNGDDRVILFQDLNGDQQFTLGVDLVVDWIGQLGQQPAGRPWAERLLLRRDLTLLSPGTDGSEAFESRPLTSALELFDYLPPAH